MTLFLQVSHSIMRLQKLPNPHNLNPVHRAITKQFSQVKKVAQS
uniref:Uncharacterized protein n=1 Tax=Rhizophora mucronata TaxID=61149 RepID=A0A2P2QWJ4_RHIMU